MTLTMTDLFSGGGGSSEGMTQAGYHVQTAANQEWAEHPENPGYMVSRSGTVRGPMGRDLRPETIKGGYLRVKLRSGHVLIHRAVVRTFVGPIAKGLEVNHKDGNKTNNRLENLELVTPSENVRHSIDVLKTERAPGMANGNAKLTDADVISMRTSWANGESHIALAHRYSIDKSHVIRVVTRKAWRHI